MGILFTDIGDVQESYTNFNFSILNVAGGAGLSYRTSMFPIRVDVAYRLNNPAPYRARKLGRFNFLLNLGSSF